MLANLDENTDEEFLPSDINFDLYGSLLSNYKIWIRHIDPVLNYY